jgi:hypothetical protein
MGGTFSINVYNGYNGISAPLLKLDGSKYTDVDFRKVVGESIGNMNDVGAIFWYDRDQAKWRSSMANEEPLHTFEYGEGAIIAVTVSSSKRVTFRGHPITSASVSIKPGMNLISIPTNTQTHTSMLTLTKEIVQQLGMSILVTYMSRRKSGESAEKLLGYTYTGASAIGGWSFDSEPIGGDALVIVSNKEYTLTFTGQGWR